jgi:eukaryotic-like serine/threonine-protein kinase
VELHHRRHFVLPLNASTGTKLWSYTTGKQVLSSPAVANGVVYVGSFDNNVYALNAKTGAKLWSYTTGSYVWSSPVVVNGTVYVGSYDGNVYAFGLK